MDPSPNNYKVLGDSIGSGGFSTVVKLQQIGQPLIYALKKTKNDHPDDEGNEVVIHSKLDHPNIVGFKIGWISFEGTI